jgi:hypothetical protein
MMILGGGNNAHPMKSSAAGHHGTNVVEGGGYFQSGQVYHKDALVLQVHPLLPHPQLNQHPAPLIMQNGSMSCHLRSGGK